MGTSCFADSGAETTPLTYGHATSGHGCAQRHPGLVLRRRPLSRRGTGRGAWPRHGPPRCRRRGRGRGVESARCRARVRARGAGPGGAGRRSPLRACPGVDRHRQAGRGRGRGRRRGDTGQRHLGVTVARGGGVRGGMGGHAHAGRAADHAARPPLWRRRQPRSTGSCAIGPAARSKPGWTRSGWIPASASARPPSTTWPCCTTSPSSWPTGSRCWWGRVARRSWGAWRRARGASPHPSTDRLAGSIATATWAMLAGASMVRVHDVSSAVEAATLVGTTRLGTRGARPAARSGAGS